MTLKSQSRTKQIKPLKIGADVGVIESTLRAIRAGIDRGAVDFHFALRGKKMEVSCFLDGRWKIVAEIMRCASQSIISRLKIMGNLSIAEKRVSQDGRIDSSESHPPFLIVTVPTNRGVEEVFLFVRTV